MRLNRRTFLAGASALPLFSTIRSQPAGVRFGLVTYLWGQDMKLPVLISTCERAGLPGVEVRTEHAHGVEPSLSPAERREVRKRFEDSSVELVGYGSNAQFHEDDPARVKENIELTKAYVRLMHDCGGSGVKVKPNSFVEGVPHEKTIEQIGRALNEVGAFGAEFGQQIRLEVHGRETSELPVIRAILEVADHPNVTICWNCNSNDLIGEGLAHNFALVQDRLGDTVHIHQLDAADYPYTELMGLFAGVNYKGWFLLEAPGSPEDPVAALVEQRKAFERMVAAHWRS